MPDETKKETTCPDSQSADESPFGNVVDDAPVASVQARDANEKDTQGIGGAGDGSDTDAPEDLKVVVLHEGRQSHHWGAVPLVGPARRVL